MSGCNASACRLMILRLSSSLEEALLERCTRVHLPKTSLFAQPCAVCLNPDGIQQGTPGPASARELCGCRCGYAEKERQARQWL